MLCVCTNPDVVTARDGITAISSSDQLGRKQMSGSPLLRKARTAVAELTHAVRAFRALSGVEMLIVPGTGLVTDAFGLRPQWAPYNLFKWVLVAKLRRARVVFLSVGAGPFYSRTGKLLVRATLQMADYRSYRDAASKRSVCEIGVRAQDDPIYPDLAFSLPPELLPQTPSPEPAGRPVVGLGLIAYQERYSTAGPDYAGHQTYLGALAGFAVELVARGYDVRLLFGDGASDPEAMTALRTLLHGRLSADDLRHITEQTSAEDTFAELSRADIVVATRFHNVLMSMILGKPVISITFHHKCAALMREMKMSDYCQEIDQIDAELLMTQFQSLEQNRDEVIHTLATGVQAARASLDEQYNLLLSLK